MGAHAVADTRGYGARRELSTVGPVSPRGLFPLVTTGWRPPPAGRVAGPASPAGQTRTPRTLGRGARAPAGPAVS